jgi:3-deoxy-D-manno-octulosonate 8-phosphate phosphatase (KDO 8-P phosphatase)
MNYKIKMRKISTFIFDVDGVLTNGDVILFKGEVVRTLNSRDGYALQQAAKEGYSIFVITGGSSEDVKQRMLALGAKEVCLKASNKLDVYKALQEKYGFDDEEVLYMGDDLPDIPVMRAVGLSACPQDAAPDVKAIVDYHSPYPGGRHCVRDVIEQTLRLQNKWLTDGAYHW